MHVGERNPEGAFLARHNIGPRDGIRHVPDHRPALFSYYRFVLSPDMENPATRYALRGFDLPEAGDGVRTRDPQLGKLMLYQLSYTRVDEKLARAERPINAPPLPHGVTSGGIARRRS